MPIFSICDRDRPLITIDFSGIPSRYPFTLMCPRDRVERILANHLEALRGNVVRRCELVRLDVMDAYADAQVRSGDGTTKTIRARWLIGYDGMHSAVREQSGIAFSGAAYEQSFVLADVRMDWPISRQQVTLFYSPDGPVLVCGDAAHMHSPAGGQGMNTGIQDAVSA